MPDTFGAVLRGWREAAGLTQGQLADKVGKSAAWVSQIEHGPPPPRRADEDAKSRHNRHGLAPPGKAECEAIGRTLGRAAGEVWAAAVVERMAAFDPDLADYHRTALASVAAITDQEQHLILTLRQSDRTGEEALVRAVSRLCSGSPGFSYLVDLVGETAPGVRESVIHALTTTAEAIEKARRATRLR